MSEGRLAGKMAIVTGGGSRDGEVGTGRATSICLAREGARVVVADIAAENAERTVAAIAEEGGEASVFAGDARLSGDCQGMVEATVERYGGLHVLVNNLGYRIQPGVQGRDVAGFNEEQYELAMDLNLKTALLASKHAIPAMAKSGGGSIINIASVDALAAARHRGVLYSISKGALPMLTRATAAFHGRDGVRANCIAPGHLHSAFAGAIDPEMRDLRRRVAPLGTEGTPWDVAWLVVFLASDESRWISGVTIPVDGGLLAEQPLLGHDFLELDVSGKELEDG